MNGQNTAEPSKLKTGFNAFLLVLWIVIMVGTFHLRRVLRMGNPDSMIPIFHRGVTRFFNIQATYKGELRLEEPTVYVCNHISYMDVFVLGSQLPGSFIAKSEVAGWPVLGKLARYQRTLFFERNVTKAKQQVDFLRQHLSSQGNLIFFPEGTSTPGTHVEPFRSSLFAAAEADTVRIQPVSVAYTHYNNERMDQQTRDYYAWYIPMPFLSHFLNGLGLGKAAVTVTYHQPVSLAQFKSRKECARHCEDQVRAGLLESLDQSDEVLPEKYLTAVGRTP